MNVSRIARALALACLFIVSARTASNAATPVVRQPDAVGQAGAPAMRTAAAALDRAAVLRKVPTGPVAAGIPQAIGAWLSAGLADARKEKKVSNRAADLHALAASLREGASLAERRPVTTPADLHANVRQVLAESAYHANVNATPAKKREQSWLGRVLQAFADWWSKVMGRAIDAAAGTPFLGNIFAFILITAAALALAFLVFRIAMTFVARRARASGSTAAGAPLTATASADETYNEACDAARNGAYGLAIALAFQAALLALDRAGRVPYDSARTAGEYRRAVRRSFAGAAASFETLARAFTYVAYAQAPAGESDWRAADAAYASVSATAAQRR